MLNEHAKAHELELVAGRIRQSIRHLLTVPSDLGSNWRHASFGAIGSGGVPRADLTEHAIELSAKHVIGEREPRVSDLVVKPKMQRGKLVSMAVSYTIKTSSKREVMTIAY